MRLLLKDGVSRCVRCGGSKERPLFEELGRLLLKDVVSRCVRCGGSKERPLFEELGRVLFKGVVARWVRCGGAAHAWAPPRAPGGGVLSSDGAPACVAGVGVHLERAQL